MKSILNSILQWFLHSRKRCSMHFSAFLSVINSSISAHTRKFIDGCTGTLCMFQIQMGSFAGKPIFILHPIECYQTEWCQQSFIINLLPSICHDNHSILLARCHTALQHFQIILTTNAWKKFWANDVYLSLSACVLCILGPNLIIILKPPLLFTCWHPLFHLLKDLLPLGCFLLGLGYLLFQIAQKVGWVYFSCSNSIG